MRIASYRIENTLIVKRMIRKVARTGSVQTGPEWNSQFSRKLQSFGKQRKSKRKKNVKNSSEPIYTNPIKSLPNDVATLQPENITYIPFWFEDELPETLHFSYTNIVFLELMSAKLCYVYVCDSENFTKKLFGNSCLGKSHFSDLK